MACGCGCKGSALSGSTFASPPLASVGSVAPVFVAPPVAPVASPAMLPVVEAGRADIPFWLWLVIAFVIGRAR